MPRPLLRILSVALYAAGVSGAALAQSPIASIDKLWSFQHLSGRSSEIVSFDSRTQALFVVGGNGIEVLNLSGQRLATLASGSYGGINSISINSAGVAAIAFSNATVSSPGTLQFFDTASFIASGGSGGHLGGLTVGAVPDMVTWSRDGRSLVVANEGERQTNANNPAGSISLIAYNSANASASTVTTLGFEAWNGSEDPLRAAGVRIQAGVSASVALEPEYVGLSADGRSAMVTLQENNAVALVDLQTQQITGIKSLGLKDFNQPAHAIDPSDQDGGINLRTVPVKGLYMPDAVVGYQAGGRSFYVMANEGDAFMDDSDVLRLGNTAVTLDPRAFPNAAELKLNSQLGRLNIVRDGATGAGNTTNMTDIVTLGGRSFSIRDEAGNLVYDSGNLLEREAIAAGLYDDARSDDKGVEPEGIALFGFHGRQIAVVGLERTRRGAAALFDITDPNNVSFLQVLDSGSTGEIRVEGLQGFEAADGSFYLALASEDPSNVTALYRINATPVAEPASLALLAGGLAVVGAVARRRRSA